MAARKAACGKMALCGQVFKIRVNDKEERDKMSSVLSGNGYPVWIETEAVVLSTDYYVCYMDQPEMKAIGPHDHTFEMTPNTSVIK